MKISFVTTVFNEEKTIESFLDSLFKQTKMPDEIIIVDAGSNDSTLSKSLPRHDPRLGDNKIKIFLKPRVTIAQGRNYGIKKATGDIIAISDAGCVLHKDWLEKITEPFVKENADIVAGFYRMTGSSPLQRALSVFLGIPPKRYNPNKFLPSARSMAFKKSLWEKIEGFNEKLDRAGEDTLFNYQAVRHGAKFVRVKDALVDWEVPKSLWDGLKKFYTYAKGDSQSAIWWHPMRGISTHNLKILTIFIRYILGFLLLILPLFFPQLIYFSVIAFALYLLWSVWKVREVVVNTRARLWLPLIQVLSDFAVMIGFMQGLKRKR